MLRRSPLSQMPNPRIESQIHNHPTIDQPFYLSHSTHYIYSNYDYDYDYDYDYLQYKYIIMNHK